MKEQEILLKAIRKQLSDHTSLISELASVLNISYDAAHRRISQKSKFSIEKLSELSVAVQRNKNVPFAF